MNLRGTGLVATVRYVIHHRVLMVTAITISSLRTVLPDTKNCVLRMRRECRERFPRNRL